MTELNELIELQQLWKRVLGELPPPEQFAVWVEMHSYETVRHSITKTAVKNLQLGGGMTLNHKVRWAARIMNNRTHDPQKLRQPC